MTCTFDRELLALVAGGDATVDEQHRTEGHLSGCPECRGIMAQHRAGALALAGAVARAPAMVRQAPRRRWAHWQVAAAIMLGVALLGVPPVAAFAGKFARYLPFFEVWEMTRQEMAEFIERFDHRGKVYYPTDFATLAEMEEAWGGKVLRPEYLPQFAEPAKYYGWFFEGEQLRTADQRYRIAAPRASWHLFITQFRPDKKLGTAVPAGSARRIKVGDREAVVARGGWGWFPGEKVKWDKDQTIIITLEVDGHPVQVKADGMADDTDRETVFAELVKIAGALK